MGDEARHPAAGVLHRHRPDGLVQIFRIVVDLARVADLAAALHVERRLGQDDLDPCADVGFVHDRAVRQQADDGGVDRVHVVVDEVLDALLVQRTVGAQPFNQRGVDGQIGRDLVHHAGAAAFLLLGQRGAVAGFVHGEAVFLGHIAGDVHGEAEGVPEEEGVAAVDLGLAFLAQVGHQAVEHVEAGVERAVEALLLVGDVLEDEVPLGHQIGVMAAHLVDDGIGHACQEGFFKADELAEARGPAQDHAQNVGAPFVAGQDAVADHEGAGAGVVGDGAVAVEVLLALRVAVTGQFLDARHDGQKRIGVIVVVGALKDAGQTFQAGAGVHAGRGQGDHLTVGLLVVLHEDQIPDFQVLVVPVDAVGHLIGQVAPVVVDLRAGAAGAGVAHGPPVVLLAEAQHPLRRRAGLDPEPLGFVVVGIDGEPHALQGQFQLVDEQLPGELNGLFLEVIAKGEVAQHLEEGVVARARPHVLQIVVLAAHTHALLGSGGAVVGALVHAQEHVLELDHSRVGQEQRGVVVRHQAATVHDRMLVLVEKVQKKLANFVGRQTFHGLSPRFTNGRTAPAINTGSRRERLVQLACVVVCTLAQDAVRQRR